MKQPTFRKRWITAAIAVAACSTSSAVFAQIAEQSASSGSETSTALPTLQVTESRLYEEATGPVLGIAATRSATGTKTDTPIIETPQSISVIGSQEFRNYGARNVNQALGYTAGVSSAYGGGGADTTHDSMMIRGFSVYNSYRDGSKYQANVFDAQQELYGLERLEVLKGPSSILYGVASPGGLDQCGQ